MHNTQLLNTSSSRRRARSATPRHYSIDQAALDQTVGWVALGLPPLLATSLLVEGSCMRDSVSHFYYAVFYGDIFVGSMFFIGTFLLAFKGTTRRDTVFAKFAGIGAIGTALFPAKGGGCESEQFASRLFAQVSENSFGLSMEPLVSGSDLGFFQLIGSAHLWHSIFAIMLSTFLAYYTMVIFTRTNAGDTCPKTGRLTETKIRQNRFFYAAGSTTVFAIFVMAGHVIAKDAFGSGIPFWDQYNGSFISETVAMSAFGVSWIVNRRLCGVSPAHAHLPYGLGVSGRLQV
ncbi:MAG: hypothetical protein AAF198_01710 [Pseudomonadota bacterium]